MAENQQMGARPTTPPSSSGFWGKIILFVAIIVAILAIVFYFMSRFQKTASKPLASKVTTITTNPKLTAGGITLGLVMNDQTAATQAPFYAATDKDGSQQTDTSFLSNQTLRQIWTYYTGYFKNNGWSVTPILSDIQAPNDPDSPFSLVFTKLSANGSVQTASVHASEVKGENKVLIDITSFISPVPGSSH